jgi:hypothetical protein
MSTANSYLHLGTDGCFQIQGSPRTVSCVEKIVASYRESMGWMIGVPRRQKFCCALGGECMAQTGGRESENEK